MKGLQNSIYIISDKPAAGKTEVGVSLIKELLSNKKAENLAYFEPVYNKLTSNENSLLEIANSNVKVEQLFTYEALIQNYSTGSFDNLIKKVIEGYNTLLKSDPENFIVIEGFDPACYSLSLDINHNITFAKNLNSPVLLIINALNDTNVDEIITRTKSVYKTITSHGLSVVNVIINNLSIEVFNDIKIKANNSFDEELRSKVDLVLRKSAELNFPSAKVLEKVKAVKSNITTPQFFKYKLLQKAKESIKHIVLAEGEDQRVLEAAVWLLNEQAVKLSILGDRNTIIEKIRNLGLNSSAEAYLNVINIADINTDDYSKTLYELRKDKGMTIDAASELMKDVSYYATMMVYKQDADGMVSGAMHTTAHTVKPALQFIKTKPGIKSVSSIFFMCLDKKVLIYGDCAITPSPTAEQLADTAVLASSYAKLMDIEPKVAMLSYSTGTSAEGPEVSKVIEATDIAKAKDPNLLIEGPIQYDAAVSKSVASSKLPNSKVAGDANIFIFPDLNAGNIAYKAVQREAKAIAIGPVLQGLNKPINDLSRGCLVEDIINTVLITAIQAESK